MLGLKCETQDLARCSRVEVSTCLPSAHVYETQVLARGSSRNSVVPKFCLAFASRPSFNTPGFDLSEWLVTVRNGRGAPAAGRVPVAHCGGEGHVRGGGSSGRRSRKAGERLGGTRVMHLMQC